jgi:NADPH:quinone reductase-like Zn-dependent oxidoreductase
VNNTLVVDDAELYYEVRGSGPLVVLVGAPMDADAFAPLAELPADDCTVLTTDPRGVKRSRLIDGGTSTPEQRADDLARLIQHVDAGPATALGSSGGAVSVLALAQRHPEVVRTAIAHEPPRNRPGGKPSPKPSALNWRDSLRSMRAISQDTFGGPEVLKAVEVDRPRPLPTEVLVRVHAVGFNPVDAKTRAGRGMAAVLGEPPFILGWDVSGVVEEVGHGVHTVAVGDEVYGMPWFPRAASAYAEYVTAPSRHFARKPTNLSHIEAAAVPLAGLTAYEVLTVLAGVRPGRRVLIHAAAGGVGHLAVQVAKALGAYVVGTASAGKHDWLRGLGADEVIDYHSADVAESTGDIDVVVDLIGSETTLTQSVAVTKPGGLLVAVPSGTSPDLLERAEESGVRVAGFLVEPDGHALGELAGLIEKGAVRVEVEEVFPLAGAAAAHRRLEAGRTRGKLVLEVR